MDVDVDVVEVVVVVEGGTDTELRSGNPMKVMLDIGTCMGRLGDRETVGAGNVIAEENEPERRRARALLTNMMTSAAMTAQATRPPPAAPTTTGMANVLPLPETAGASNDCPATAPATKYMGSLSAEAPTELTALTVTEYAAPVLKPRTATVKLSWGNTGKSSSNEMSGRRRRATYCSSGDPPSQREGDQSNLASEVLKVVTVTGFGG